MRTIRQYDRDTDGAERSCTAAPRWVQLSHPTRDRLRACLMGCLVWACATTSSSAIEIPGLVYNPNATFHAASPSELSCLTLEEGLYRQGYELFYQLGVMDPPVWALYLTIHTDDSNYAGTDDSVYVQVNGDEGPKQYLDLIQNDFDRGDAYTYQLLNSGVQRVSDIHSIRIGQEGSDGWCADRISLSMNWGTPLFTHDFPGCQWLDNDDSVTIPIAPIALSKSLKHESMVLPFHIDISPMLETALGDAMGNLPGLGWNTHLPKDEVLIHTRYADGHGIHTLARLEIDRHVPMPAWAGGGSELFSALLNLEFDVERASNPGLNITNTTLTATYVNLSGIRGGLARRYIRDAVDDELADLDLNAILGNVNIEFMQQAEAFADIPTGPTAIDFPFDSLVALTWDDRLMEASFLAEWGAVPGPIQCGPASLMAFYKPSTELGKIFDAAIKEGRSPLTQRSENDDWLLGLDVLVPLTFSNYADSQAVLQYDGANGKAQLHTLQTTGAATLTKAYQWRSGWDFIIPLYEGNHTDLFFYRREIGNYKVYRMEANGTIRYLSGGDRASGWEHIVPGYFDDDDSTDLFFFDTHRGRVNVLRNAGSGRLIDMRGGRTYITEFDPPEDEPQAQTSTGYTAWNNISSAFSLTYQSSSIYGSAATYQGVQLLNPTDYSVEIPDNSVYVNLGSEPVEEAHPWDLVVPVSIDGDAFTDLIFYRKDGTARFYTTDGTGSGERLREHQLSSGWEIMEPLAPGYAGRPGLLCYDKNYGHVRIYTIDQAGGMEEDYRSRWGANWAFMKSF